MADVNCNQGAGVGEWLLHVHKTDPSTKPCHLYFRSWNFPLKTLCCCCFHSLACASSSYAIHFIFNTKKVFQINHFCLVRDAPYFILFLPFPPIFSLLSSVFLNLFPISLHFNHLKFNLAVFSTTHLLFPLRHRLSPSPRRQLNPTSLFLAHISLPLKHTISPNSTAFPECHIPDSHPFLSSPQLTHAPHPAPWNTIPLNHHYHLREGRRVLANHRLALNREVVYSVSSN